MGFRTLAIEKQSGEVLKLLDATRKAFGGFTDAIDRTQRSLRAAQNNLEDASRKSRSIEKELVITSYSIHYTKLYDKRFSPALIRPTMSRVHRGA